VLERESTPASTILWDQDLPGHAPVRWPVQGVGTGLEEQRSGSLPAGPWRPWECADGRCHTGRSICAPVGSRHSTVQQCRRGHCTLGKGLRHILRPTPFLRRLVTLALRRRILSCNYLATLKFIDYNVAMTFILIIIIIIIIITTTLHRLRYCF